MPLSARCGLLVCGSLFALRRRLPRLREPCLLSRCWGFIPRHRRAVLMLYRSLCATTTGRGSHSRVVHCWSARVRDHSWCSLHLIICRVGGNPARLRCITGIAGLWLLAFLWVDVIDLSPEPCVMNWVFPILSETPSGLVDHALPFWSPCRDMHTDTSLVLDPLHTHSPRNCPVRYKRWRHVEGVG